MALPPRLALLPAAPDALLAATAPRRVTAAASRRDGRARTGRGARVPANAEAREDAQARAQQGATRDAEALDIPKRAKGGGRRRERGDVWGAATSTGVSVNDEPHPQCILLAHEV